MSYTIDIIDTQDSSHTIAIEQAARSSVVLEWQGSDAKDSKFIIGSSLRFTMLDPDYNDGLFDSIFTGNETRFKARLYLDAGNKTIWQGFLLPDSYSEPYHNGVIEVSFTATDGLGRLKGKYLADDFYTDEKSVIDIISACLAKTGLVLPLYFTPAIENAIVKDYQAIYLDTLHFIKKDKKQDAYKILNSVLKDMLCKVYQCDDRWYIDALNKTQFVAVNYKHYDAAGAYVGDVELVRALKESKPLMTPEITMVPPYGEIIVTHERTQLQLPETIDIEANDGWGISSGVIGEIFATHWAGNNDYYAKAYHPDYIVALPAVLGTGFDDVDVTQFISLKAKLYVAPGITLSFSLEFKPSRSPVYAPSTSAFFENGTKGEILIDGVVKHEFLVQFDNADDEYSTTVAFDILPLDAGLLDIRIYQPFCNNTVSYAHIENFLIEKITLDQTPFIEQEITQDSINDEYTIVKDHELVFADDYTGQNKAFLLSKQRTLGATYNTINVPVLYGQTILGVNYTTVQLDGANLIKDNIDTVYYNDVLLTDLQVVYNLNQGEQMVIITNAPITSGSFDVRVYNVNDIAGDRAHWQQWTDAVFQIESERYAQIIANVYRRMFNVPHYKLNMTLNQSVKINDILTFPYKLLQNYFITNCRWVIDECETTVTAIKGYYQNDIIINPGDNIPPIVIAGDDIYLTTGVTIAAFAATAYDPDGFIATIIWEKISGDNDAIIETPGNLITNLTGLNGDAYTFKITVTDNEGATASDTVGIYRIKEYDFNNTISCTTDENHGSGQGSYQIRRRIFTIPTTPVLPDGLTLNLSFSFENFAQGAGAHTDAGDFLGATCVALGARVDGGVNNVIYKNGFEVFRGPSNYLSSATVNINMVSGDVIQIQIEALVPPVDNNTRCTLTEAVDVDGETVITGLPLEVLAFDG